MKPNVSKKALTPEDHKCPFCAKVMVRESSLLRHFCRLKKRHLEQDQHHVRLGFFAYETFFRIHYRKKATRDEFQKSSLYDGFVKFGKYVLDVNAIAPEEFIRYAVQSKQPLDKWACPSDKLYMEYVRVLNKVESYDRALERTVRLAESWANKEGKEIKNFFREISTGRAVQWLISGRISPWVIFNSNSGKVLLAKFSDEQFELLSKAIDLKFWTKKFQDNMNDVKAIQDFLDNEGI